MAEFNTQEGVTPQDAPNLDKQMDSLFEFAKAAPVTEQVAVEEVKEEVKEGTDVGNQSLVETKEEVKSENTESNQIVDTDKEFLINRFKTETGFDGDIDLSLDSFISVTKSIQDELKTYKEDEEIRQFAEHKAKGGTIDTFKAIPKAPDFSKVYEALVPTNIELAEQLVRDDLTQRGIRPSLIEANINTLKDTGELHEEALAILKTVEEESLKDYNTQIKSIQEQEAQQQQLVQESWNKVHEIFKGNVINGNVIEQKELTEFKSLVLPDKNGNSKIMEMRQALTVDEQLFLDYIVYKRFNVNNIKGVIGKPTIPKNDLSLTMLSGNNTPKKSTNNTDELLSELANFINK